MPETGSATSMGGMKRIVIAMDGSASAAEAVRVGVDLAVEQGGNIEGSEPGKIVDKNGVVIGADADLSKAIGQVMGLKADVKNVTFDSIIPNYSPNSPRSFRRPR
jgi:ABC-type amino acid transport substrate-binding protein